MKARRSEFRTAGRIFARRLAFCRSDWEAYAAGPVCGLNAFSAHRPMPVYAFLLRGINVGGKNPLPMKALATSLETLQCERVRTYIQSGQAVFRSPRRDAKKFGQQIGDQLEADFGFRPHVFLRTRSQLESIAQANPFPTAEADPKTLHLFLLDSVRQDFDLSGLERLKADSEEFELQGDVFYLYAPEGIGRSKLAAQVERQLGVPVTARNWRTVTKLLEMMRDLDADS
jgi:uncharacterized protein (DUF1697 family)